LQSQAVTLRSKTTNLTDSNWGNVGVMPEGFSPIDIAEVDFDDRKGDRG